MTRRKQINFIVRCAAFSVTLILLSPVVIPCLDSLDSYLVKNSVFEKSIDPVEEEADGETKTKNGSNEKEMDEYLMPSVNRKTLSLILNRKCLDSSGLYIVLYDQSIPTPPPESWV